MDETQSLTLTNPSQLSPTNLAVRDAEQIRAEMAERFHAFDEIRQLGSADQEALFTMLIRAQAGDQQILRDIYSLVYDELPVPFEEFLFARHYLGLRGKISPAKVDLLSLFVQPNVRKFWCAAGSGSGKSFSVSVVQAWEIYNLLCLKRPELFYMLGPGSKIATVNLSVAKDQAKDVVFAEFMGRIKNCPWFNRKYTEQVSRCVFQKDVTAISGGSNAASFFGYHTKMGCVDEASFLLDREGKSLAEDLVEALVKSLATRFPGSYKLMVISTLRADDDFLYTNIERIKADGVPLRVTKDPYAAA